MIKRTIILIAVLILVIELLLIELFYKQLNLSKNQLSIIGIILVSLTLPENNSTNNASFITFEQAWLNCLNILQLSFAIPSRVYKYNIFYVIFVYINKMLCT